MANEFTLTIRLGNDAMQSGNDIAEALVRAANYINDYHQEIEAGDALSLKDQNGNRVGEWKVY